MGQILGTSRKVSPFHQTHIFTNPSLELFPNDDAGCPDEHSNDQTTIVPILEDVSSTDIALGTNEIENPPVPSFFNHPTRQAMKEELQALEKIAGCSPELAPVQIRGYVLLAPFFGGTVRTRSEAEGPKDAFLNLELIDRYWRLSIPVGETTDHPLVNPFGPASQSLEFLKLDPILVMVGGSDLLRDRIEEYAERLKKLGKKIEYVEFEGKQHGFFTIDPNSEAANQLMLIIKRFITENSG
ncbi:hypothetical protein SLEP1_g7294 [Rubroshorea leprosula]|uniref:Alpha/beta hydrolase fold-3 domain-containing protein n=1 Tax=Rubroshorea leprosula TaxID=152421 RepID=A0AAV5I7U1_9ROSI|nr:hypothetical protein SLEP1_g7294 [Rubroshorea leprosula]